MADPVVHITDGIPDSGTGNITTLGQLQIALLAALPAALGTSGGLKIDGSGTPIAVSGTITANAGTNLNTSTLAVESGGNLAALVTILGAVTASPAANTIGDRLKAINSTLSGTLTIASPAVTNAGTFAVQATQAGTWNVTNISGTISLPTGAATSAKQPAIGAAGSPSTDVLSIQGISSGTAIAVSATSLPLPIGAATSAIQTGGSQKSQIVDGSGAVVGSTGNALDVNIKSGSGGTSSVFGATMPLSGTAVGIFDGTNMVRLKGDETNGIWVNIKTGAGSGGTSAVDEAAFVAGTSSFTPGGGFYQTVATSNPLTSGQVGLAQLTINRAYHTNLRTAVGVEIGTSGSPLFASAVITGTAAVTQSGTWTVTQSGTWNITNVSGTVSLPTGASTAAKQPALGTAGTASSDVISVQGITSMTPLKVDGSGVTQPVSLTSTTITGTVAVTQSGTWNVTNISGTVSLPTGASTAAKQPALGTAGAAAADVISVQGIASMTPLKVDGSGVTQPVSLTSTTITGTVAVAQSGSWSLTANQSVNNSQINGVTPLMGNGVTGTGSQRVTIASDNTAFSVNAIQSGTWSVGASSATGSAVPANAYYKGAIAKTSLPAAATDGNLVGVMADKFGRQVVIPHAIRDLVGTAQITLSGSVIETTLIAAAASTFNDLAMIVVSNTSSATNSRIDFRDTTGGAVIFSLESIAGSGPVGFTPPIPIPQTTVNTNWTAQCATSTTDIRIFAQFVKNK